ncbi:MAG TPA: zinc ribbon domain-containing protein [Anaerolineaceae bacterium]|jgi:RNA polymerase subunit RPABC4/transcription elongation factor Spt4|nr:zinc ribbon domain-containing protein [Anaerolineaceae bacterium]
MFSDPSTLNDVLLVLTGFSAISLVALWIGLAIWVWRDVRNRSTDPLFRVLAVVLSVVLFFPGVLVYLLLRPSRSLDDEYQADLEEEAMLQAIEESSLCPGCNRKTHEDWILCPYCHTKLRKTCHHCGKIMDLPWNLCPYCGTPAPGMRRENLTMEEALRSLPMEETE